MKIHTFTQKSEEWQKIRLGKLTASDGQTIATAGKGLETLVYTKVAQKLTGIIPEGYSNADIERGNELEEMARNAYELETGNVVKQIGFCEFDEYSGASPDGLIDKDGLVELKCPNDKNFVEYLYTNKVDMGYFWQMQMQMYVTERQWCDYAVFNPNFSKSLIIKKLNKDEKAIEKIKNGLNVGKEMIIKIMGKIRRI